MGLLNRLFRAQASHTAPAAPLGVAASPTWQPGRERVRVQILEGNETLEVVGESHYLTELWSIVGQHRRGGPVRFPTIALLVPEPENPYDKNAIKVVIDGLQVGHLSRTDAPRYRPGILKLMDDAGGALVGLRAEIVGRGDDDRDLLGVFLEHDPADFGFRVARVFGTGKGEVELSWDGALNGETLHDISTVRRLLEGATDAIDRHFMWVTLERLLYAARDTFASAIPEYDAACEQHHDEMLRIRPALLHEFGGIPLLELYKQEAIRWKKAHDWEKTQLWAQRGLEIYAADALRPEDVTDLQRRLESANAKLAAAARRS